MSSEGEKILIAGYFNHLRHCGRHSHYYGYRGFFDAFAGERRVGRMMDPDRMFIEQMIPHHQDAIDMGNLALVRAEHPEIRQLAENVIRDQSREISPDAFLV